MEFSEFDNNPESNHATNSYEVDGTPIEVSWKRILPDQGEVSDPTKATIFLPGWSMGESVSSPQRLNQSFADYSGNQVFSISTRAEKVIPNSLFHEAEAIRRFVKESGIKEITITAHSEAGSKAVDLAVLLQNTNPEIIINGLVLIDAVGLYEQGAGSLAYNFAKDSLVDTLPSNLREKRPGLKARVSTTLMAGFDIVKGGIKEAVRSRSGYPKRFINQVREMAQSNPYVKEVKVPVILIQGAHDPISSHETLVPRAEEEKISKKLLEEAEAQEKDLSRVNPILRAREQYLKENIFPQSPHVRMLVAEKFGHHGLPLFRSEDVAQTSLYLLKRWHRSEHSTPQENVA